MVLQRITNSDQIESPIIRQLFAYWQSKCVDGVIPKRADMDPAEIPKLMPYLLIVDIEHDPFRVRYRLAGTRVVQMTGFEITGKYLDEIALPDDEGPFLECYALASESKTPVLARIKWHIDADTISEYDICVLPLSDDGATVNMAIAIESYENIERSHPFLGIKPRY
jgi:hypothetical protein